MATVAVVIPTYNRAGSIPRALQSVMAQQSAVNEVIVVDDGSTDETAAVVTGWASILGPRLRLVSKRNGGAASARNAGIKEATSEFVAFLDSDDTLLPHHLETLLRPFACHQDAAACFGDTILVFPDRTQPSSFLGRLERGDGLRSDGSGDQRFFELENAFAAILPGNPIPTSSSIVRRDLAVRAGLFPEDLARSEDRVFWLRVARLGRLYFTKTVLSAKHHEGDNLTAPPHVLAVALDSVRAVSGVLSGRFGIDLNAAERRLAEKVRDEALRDLRYASSGLGWSQYWTIASTCAKESLCPRRRFAADVRSVLRSCLGSVKRH